MSYEAILRVGIKASTEEVFAALTDPKKLARWWTSDTRGSSKVGDTLEFWFGNFCQTFEVEALESNKLVRWKALEQGMGEWVGTKVAFTINTDAGQTFVRFRHSGFKADTDFFAHCSTKWATFLLSLKNMLETGAGTPAPNDIQIEHRRAS